MLLDVGQLFGAGQLHGTNQMDRAAGIESVAFTATGLMAVALLGVLAGWWATLAIRRVPKGEPVLRSWPRCHACDRYLSLSDLVPVVSWVLLRGKCRQCAARLGWHYPALELVTGGIFVLLTW